MTAAANGTGIALSVLKAAKRAGCPAFANSRVDLRKLLEWWFSNPETEDAPGGWGERLRMFQAKREELKLAKDEGKTVDRGEVADAISAAFSALSGEIDRVFTCELPPDLKGLDEISIRNKMVAAMARVWVNIRPKFRAIGEGKA